MQTTSKNYGDSRTPFPTDLSTCNSELVICKLKQLKILGRVDRYRQYADGQKIPVVCVWRI